MCATIVAQLLLRNSSCDTSAMEHRPELHDPRVLEEGRAVRLGLSMRF